MFVVCDSNSISLRILSFVGIRNIWTVSDTDFACGERVFDWLLA